MIGPIPIRTPSKNRIRECLEAAAPNRDRRDFGRLPNEMQRDVSIILEAYALDELHWR